MLSFIYSRPTSLEQAEELMLSSDDDALFLAGGHTLLPAMKQRLRAPDRLIDLSRIPGLTGISKENDKIAIGALTCHATVAFDAQVGLSCPALSHLAGQIGDMQVRNRGTLGGSLANNDPASDYPAAVLALDATIITNRRQIKADSFFQGMFTTALEPGEIITSVLFSIPDHAGYGRFAHPASRYALVGIFVAKFGTQVRVAITGASSGVFRWTEAECALSSHYHVDSVSGLRLPVDELNSDIHASAEYRAHLASVLLKQSVIQSLS